MLTFGDKVVKIAVRGNATSDRELLEYAEALIVHSLQGMRQ